MIISLTCIPQVTPESPSPSLSTPVHFSKPTAVKDSPPGASAPPPYTPPDGGEPVTEGDAGQARVAMAHAAGGDSAQDKDGVAATASETVRV